MLSKDLLFEMFSRVFRFIFVVCLVYLSLISQLFS